ncbi:hypothetical protein [Bacillus marinisedimentorum]|uniref:hypothetical protein n=1 Tax=Bacillus marinisedimentorum TaxID=1821260 RepID=UPI00087205A4|nr:hypothetical protein [Bacillus marinisedimentorum]
MAELLAVVLDLLAAVMEFAAYAIFGKPTTKRIEKNADKLRQLDWFKELYSNEKYRRLIQIDKNIRREIGKASIKKILNDRYAEDKFRIRLTEMLERQAAGVDINKEELAHEK